MPPVDTTRLIDAPSYLTRARELLAEFAVVVYLPVEDDHEPA